MWQLVWKVLKCPNQMKNVLLMVFPKFCQSLNKLKVGCSFALKFSFKIWQERERFIVCNDSANKLNQCKKHPAGKQSVFCEIQKK